MTFNSHYFGQTITIHIDQTRGSVFENNRVLPYGRSFFTICESDFQPRMLERAEAIQVGTDRPMIGRMADAFFE